MKSALWVLWLGLFVVGCSRGVQAPGLDDTGDIDRNGELCDNGLDDNGDGQVDETCPCAPGDQQDCYAGDPGDAGEGVCTWGTQNCNSSGDGGSWDECRGWGEPDAERCDGADNDCDGNTDPGCDCEPGDEDVCYDGPLGTVNVGACTPGQVLCLATDDGSEWSDCTGWAGPAAEEICNNGVDDNCNRQIDEGCTCDLDDTQACYGGPDVTEGVGACHEGVQTCIADGLDTLWGPCEDSVEPAEELCTGGQDEDCDGDIDCDDADCEDECCEAYEEAVAVVPAEGEILFLIDRSGSMDWPALNTTRTRWLELTDAMNTTLPALSGLHMGLLTFPLMDGTSESLNCEVSSTLDVSVALGTRPTIASRLVAADPRAGDTPTPQALATAQAWFTANSSARERFVILATDGLPEPNCGSTVPATVSAIAALRTAGIDTFVIGIVGPSNTGDTSGIPALQAGLNDMADAGGRARSGAIRYYEAGDETALTSALASIVASATNCEFTLSSAPPAGYRVTFNGSTVAPANYSLVGTDLSFTGAACSQIQSGSVTAIRVEDVCQ